MYFRPNLHYKKGLSCARTTGYDQGFSLSVNGQKVKKADKVKFLGVIIDENLTWDDQIKHLENKLLATIAIVLIKRVKKVYPILTLFKNLPIFICMTSYLWHILLGRSILFQTTKIIQHTETMHKNTFR